MIASATLDEFLADPPNLHGTTTKNYLGLNKFVLCWIVDNVEPTSTIISRGLARKA